MNGLEPLAILISTVIGSGLGAAWYSPALLGNAWMAELGKSAEELGCRAPRSAAASSPVWWPPCPSTSSSGPPGRRVPSGAPASARWSAGIISGAFRYLQ